MNTSLPTTERIRCEWPTTDPLMIDYHDHEWGLPLHDDQELFEFLILEGMQAGLSWITILRKRDNFRTAFDGFDPQVVARYDEAKFEELMANPGIIRNRRKIESAKQNALAFLEVQDEFGSFDAYMWQFVGGKAIGEFLENDERDSSEDRAVGSHEQRFEKTRLQLCWSNNLLCAYAGHRDGQ